MKFIPTEPIEQLLWDTSGNSAKVHSSPKTLPFLDTFGTAEVQLRGAAAAKKLARIGGSCGWALDALIFEYEDGTRGGTSLDVHSVSLPLTDPTPSPQNWRTIDAGDRVEKVSGHNCKERAYLGYDITFHLQSGETIFFGANHIDWKGTPFEFDVPPGQSLVDVNFDIKGNCSGLATTTADLSGV